MGVPGVANVAIWGQRDRQLQVQVDPERLRRNDVSLAQRHRDRRQRPAGSRRSRSSTRRPRAPAASSTARTSASASSTSCPFAHARATWRQVPVDGAAAAAAARRRRDRRRGPSAADRRRGRRRRRRGLHARRREAARREHAGRHAPASSDALASCGRASAGVHDRLERLPPGELHRDGDRQPAAALLHRRRCSSRSCWPRSSCSGAPARDRLVVDPALADRGAARPRPDAARRSTRSSSRGSPSRCGAVVDDAVGGRAEHGARACARSARPGSDTVDQRASCSTRAVPMRSATGLRDADRPAARCCRCSSVGGLTGAFAAPARAVLRAGGAGVDGGGADASTPGARADAVLAAAAPAAPHVAARRAAAARPTGALARGSIGARRGTALVAAGAVLLVAVGSRSLPLHQRGSAPSFKDRSCWSSWDGDAEHVAARDGPHHGAGRRPSCARVPGVRDGRRPRRPRHHVRPGRSGSARASCG